MKQRVSIARALAVDPEALLMDEPFAALDAQNRSHVQEEMGRILAGNDPQVRKTMILVTHSIEEAILLSDRIFVSIRRPGRVKADIRIELPRAHHETDPEFIGLKQRVCELIHDEFEPEHQDAFRSKARRKVATPGAAGTIGGAAGVARDRLIPRFGEVRTRGFTVPTKNSPLRRTRCA